MNRRICLGVAMALGLLISATPRTATAQNMTNVVDFDLSEIINCLPNDSIPTVICNSLLDILLDDLIEAERFIDEVFVGYREDIPPVIRNQLVDPVIIRVRLVDNADDNALAFVVPGEDEQIDFVLPDNIPPFFTQFLGFRSWSVTRFSTVNINVDFVIFLLVTDGMVPTIVHEVMHSLGHPRNFEITNLNGLTGGTNDPQFVGDVVGINDVGFGITEFRNESDFPLATSIPLSTTDGGGHLSDVSPVFFRPDEFLQEAFVPVAAPPGFSDFMSRSLRGMFADLGFVIRGVNAPGIIDIDGDGIDDEPLLISPNLPTDP